MLELLVSGIHRQALSAASNAPSPEAHIPLRSQAHCQADCQALVCPHQVGKSRAEEGLQGSTCLDAGPPAPDPLLTKTSVEATKSMTDLAQGSSPTFHADLLRALEFPQPAGTSSSPSAQLHPARPSPGCCPVLRPLSLFPSQPQSSGSVCSGAEKRVSLTLFQQLLPRLNFSPSDLRALRNADLFLSGCRFNTCYGLPLPLGENTSPVGWVPHPEAGSIRLEFPLPH